MEHLYRDPYLSVCHEGDRILVSDIEDRKNYIFLKSKERKPDTNVFKRFKTLSELEKKLRDVSIPQEKIDSIIKTM